MYMPHRLPNCCRRSWRETANGATLRRCRRQRRRSGHSAQLRSKRSSSRRQWLDATSSISQYYFHIQCIHYTVVELWGGPRGPGPPERPGGPFETPGLRGYRGPLKAPPLKSPVKFNTWLQHINIILSIDGDAPTFINHVAGDGV